MYFKIFLNGGYTLISIKNWWFLIGILIFSPVLRLPTSGSYLVLYNIPLFLFFMYVIFIKRELVLYRYKIPAAVFCLFFILSTVVGLFYIPSSWWQMSFIATVKVVLIFFCLTMLNNDKELHAMREGFFSAVKIIAPVQFIWIIFQLVAFFYFGIRLNTEVFGVSTSSEFATGITLTGLSWERADVVLLFVIATAICRNKYYRVLCLVGVLLTLSRTGFLMLAVVYLTEFFCDHNLSFKLTTIKNIFKYLIIAIFCLLFTILIFPEQFDTIVDFISNFAGRFIWLFTDVAEYGGEEVDGHKLYYFWLPYTLANSSPIQLLFGIGFRVSGWVYTYLFGRFSTIGPWAIECDFVSLIIGCGLLGTISYYYLMYKIYKINCNIIKNKAIIIALFLGTFTYAFIHSATALIIMLLLYSKYNAVGNTKMKT